MIETQKEIFLWLEKCFGTKEAVVDYPSGKRWSYQDFNDYSRRICASYKKDGGVQKGDRVTWLSLLACTDITALSFGARKMGAIPVILNARAGIDDIAWMIKNVEAKSLAYTSDFVDTVRELRKVGIPSVREYIALGERGSFPGEIAIDEIYKHYKGTDEPDVKVIESDDCFISYTSGTTAKPKPVVHKEAGWSWTIMTQAYMFNMYFDDVPILTLAPTFIGWAHTVGACFRSAAKLCCIRFTPYTFLKAVTDERGTHGLLMPTLIRMLYPEYKKHPEEFKLDSLRLSLIAGEVVTEDVVSMFKEMFPNAQRMSGLGATEIVSTHSGPNSYYLSQHWGTLGKPLPGLTAELRDTETGEVIMEPDTVGELYVKGPGVAKRIWNDPEATEKNFPNGWWKTGDLLTVDKNGYYFIAGRSDFMFKSGGIKVYSEEVEANLKKHPDVLDAVVVPVSHEKFGLVPFAHIRNKRPLTAEEMEKWWLEQQFARFNRPREWKFWGEKEFPIIGSGKLDRRTLKSMAQKKE